MIDKSKVLYDCGHIEPSMLGHDLFNPMHLRFTVRLDHQIDPELLGEAWERTKRVYPIIDAVLGFDVGNEEYYREDRSRLQEYASTHMYLMKPEGGRNTPIRSEKAIIPGTEHTAGRLIAVTYHDDTLMVGSYHLLIDGRGFQLVLSTLLYSYLALYTAHEDEHPVVELREGRSIEEYYVASTPELVFSYDDFTPMPIHWLPLGCKGFWDDDMVYREGVIHAGVLEVDSADFMGLCKSNGANPSTMISLLLGRAAYRLNPDRDDNIVLGFTVSARDVLDLPDSIANVDGGAVSYVTRDDIERRPLAEVARRIRAEVGEQRSRDYFLTYWRVFNTYREEKDFDYRTVTYMGTFTIGDNDHHIREMTMGTNGCANLYLFELNGRFVLSLYYGDATQKYLDEFVSVFEELGVQANITHPARLMDNDAPAPVL